jgi:hypothetical protein
MRKAPLVCWSLLLLAFAGAQPAPSAIAGVGPLTASMITVSECHVYAYLRDTVVTPQQKRRSATRCKVGEARPRNA